MINRIIQIFFCLALQVILISCEEEKFIPKTIENELQFFPVEETNYFFSNDISDRIITRLIFEDPSHSRLIREFENVHEVRFDFDTPVLSSFKNTELTMLSFKASKTVESKYTFCLLFEDRIQEGLPIRFIGGIIVNTIKVTDFRQQIDYYRLDGEMLGSLTSENGMITNSRVYNRRTRPVNCPSYLGEAWCHFGGCVKYTLTKFTDGSLLGSLAGIGCLAFGAECAITIAGGCFTGSLLISDW